jgi:hypothetical protein
MVLADTDVRRANAGRAAAGVLGHGVPGSDVAVRAADAVWHADFDADHRSDLENP